MLYDELPGLPQGDVTKGLNVYNLIQETERRMQVKQEYEIDIVAVKAHVKAFKAVHKSNAFIAEWKVGVCRHDAQHIFDAYSILGGDIKFYQCNQNQREYAILESENGKAVICPLRPKDGGDCGKDD